MNERFVQIFVPVCRLKNKWRTVSKYDPSNMHWFKSALQEAIWYKHSAIIPWTRIQSCLVDVKNAILEPVKHPKNKHTHNRYWIDASDADMKNYWKLKP